MTKRFVTLFLVLLMVSSVSMFGQEKSFKTKAPLKTEPIGIQDIKTPVGTDIPVTESVGIVAVPGNCFSFICRWHLDL